MRLKVIFFVKIGLEVCVILFNDCLSLGMRFILVNKESRAAGTGVKLGLVSRGRFPSVRKGVL